MVLIIVLQASNCSSNQQKRKSDYHSSQHHQTQQNQQRAHKTDQNQNDAALVVCGVDGTVYTFDAWTGDLRGLFASGPALVSSSTLNQEDEDENEYENENNNYGDDNNLDDEMENVENDNDDSHPFENDFDFNLDSKKNDSIRQKYNVKGSAEENSHQHSHDHKKEGKNQQYRERRQYRHQSSRLKEQIVPGLDGNIYTLTHDDQHQKQNDNRKNVRLDKLPISVMDVIESPVSTCTKYEQRQTGNNFGDGFEKEKDMNEEECGIVMGEKKAKVFALDVSTGSVRWMQHPSSSDMGFTSPLRRDSYGIGVGVGVRVGYNRSQKRKRKNGLVLLQREDYFVRKIDVQSGEEWWNISIAHFSALDFSSPIQKEYDDGLISSGSFAYRKNQNMNKFSQTARGFATNPTPIGSTTPLELPRASSLERRETSGFTPIHATDDNDNNANNEKSDSSLNSNIWLFPSIAFGQVSSFFVFKNIDPHFAFCTAHRTTLC